MKQHVQQSRIRLLTVIMAGVASVGFATAATAAGVGVNTNAGAWARVAAPGTPLASGAADAHLDAYVSAQWHDGAARGGSRSAARMDANGPGLSNRLRPNARLRAEVASDALPP
jgi:hypothetical protein